MEGDELVLIQITMIHLYTRHALTLTPQEQSDRVSTGTHQ